jgi:hypothetical protein
MLFEPHHIAAAAMFFFVWILVGDISIAGRRPR